MSDLDRCPAKWTFAGYSNNARQICVFVCFDGGGADHRSRQEPFVSFCSVDTPPKKKKMGILSDLS